MDNVLEHLSARSRSFVSQFTETDRHEIFKYLQYMQVKEDIDAFLCQSNDERVTDLSKDEYEELLNNCAYEAAFDQDEYPAFGRTEYFNWLDELVDKYIPEKEEIRE